jgi:drug/metabolite transporter (DMT)-like permease
MLRCGGHSALFVCATSHPAIFPRESDILMTTAPHRTRWMVIAAFATVYIIWGSSYLGIHFALETLPPFLMTGMRFLIGALLLYVWTRAQGVPAPTRAHWRSAAVLGFLLFVLNNGGIVWAEEQGVPTGVVALLISTMPIWIVLLNWLRPGGARPTRQVAAGVLMGFAGVGLLIFSSGDMPSGSFGVLPALVVIGAGFCWALGSLYGKSAPLPASALQATGMQLLTGSLMQLALSVLSGELWTFDPASVSFKSVAAMVYLAIVSSVIAFSAFVWLMRTEPPERVSTYAYVNPVIAVILGWALADERLSPLTLVAAAIIVISVVMIVGGKSVRTRVLRWLRPDRRAAPDAGVREAA